MRAMQGFTSLATLAQEQVSADYSRRSLIGEKLMISWARMSSGMHAASHHHPHEQAFWILSGSVDFRLGDERRRCHAGDLVLVPPDVEHEVWCLEDTEFATMLAPPRIDLAPGAPLPAHLVMDGPDRTKS
jgi:quercetin dioxygenase-like cupin family protein